MINYSGMSKIWIVGCNGQLGKALNQLFDNRDVEVLNTDVDSVDITNLEDVLAYANLNRPEVIINCAAYTAVDLCESDVDNVYKVNAIGPRNLAIAARKIKARIVHVSTDYVFNGEATSPYTEFDPTDPQSVYGTSKLAGENFVREFAPKHYVVRTAWLYGEGKNFVKTMLRIGKENGTVRVVNDQIGSPTSAIELAKVIIHLIDTPEYGTYHATCEGQCSWYDFAVEIFRLFDLTVEVIPISTKEYATPAKRPTYSVLENYMLKLTGAPMMSHWKTAIEEYATDIKKQHNK